MPLGVYKRTAEHKRKISIRAKNAWKNNKWSTERNKKISQSLQGKKFTKNHILNLSKSHKGKKLSEEHKRKLSEALIEQYLKGRIGCWKGKHFTKEHIKKLSEANRGIKNPAYGKHYPCSPETRKKRKEATKGIKNWNWKGGITPLINKIRNCFKYRQWRSDVFTKDDWTCQKCNMRGCYLEAHHIKPFSKIIEEYNIKYFEEAIDCEELWDINNGITLCTDCHILTRIKKGKK